MPLAVLIRALRSAAASALEFEAAPFEQRQVRDRAISGIGPHIAGGAVAIEHRAELAAVSKRGFVPVLRWLSLA